MNTTEKKNSQKFYRLVAEVSKNLSQFSNQQIAAPRQNSMGKAINEKKVIIYKNGDNSFEGLKLVINTDQFESMQAFLDDISEKIGLTNSAKKLYTLNGELIQSMEQIVDNKRYVAAMDVFTPLLYGQMEFMKTSGRMSRKNSENTAAGLVKVAALRTSRSVEMKKDERRAWKKSKSSAPTQNRPSLGNDASSKGRKTKETKVERESNIADAISALSESKATKVASASSSALAVKHQKATKMAVKVNPTSTMTFGGKFQHSLLSTGKRPSTISIKNRTPTPKPECEIVESNKDSTSERKNTKKRI